ncbi:hypothetical protein [Rosenbergiella epipactidis]|uniref:hypothetical protein n=1 Tax=Rosenbergiella epipactidis TaxID=1544694 RepID=UPI001F4D9FCE|nr:hypothetical protein [Rosenbergiella epipactidis]
MIVLTKERHEELTNFINASKEHRCTVYAIEKQRELEALRDQIALGSLSAKPVTWWTGPEPTECGIREEIHDHESGCHQIPLFTAPPVLRALYPEKLPCDVSVSPNVTFRKGVRTQVLINALIRKSRDLLEKEGQHD